MISEAGREWTTPAAGCICMWNSRLGRVSAFLFFSAACSGCDLSTKYWAQASLPAGGAPVPVASPWLELSLAYNKGTAFSFIRDAGDHGWCSACLRSSSSRLCSST